MDKLQPNLSLPNPKLRIIAEAAYLVSQKAVQENCSNIVYSNSYFYSLQQQGYKLFDFCNNKKDGFCAILLGNPTNELLLTIRGTDFFDFNIYYLLFGSLFTQVPGRLVADFIEKFTASDLYSDLQIALGKVPSQYQTAEIFITKIINLYPQHKITVTGHSLGGLLAQLIAAKFSLEAVVFDSPGASKNINELVGRAIDLQKISIINDLPNFINTCGEHIKTPIVVNNGGIITLNAARNFLGTMPHKYGKKAKYLCSHGMEDILNAINSEGVYTQVPIASWPKNCMTFYKSREAYEVMPEIYDAYIYHMWQRQCKDPFKVKRLDFAAYKKDFLNYKLR